MSFVTIDSQAYSKAILHCCKYTSEFVCGVLTGTQEKESIKINDSFPLFHHNLLQAPLETAFSMIESYLKESEGNVAIVGFYYANELFIDTQIPKSVLSVMSTIEAHFPKAILMQIVNSELNDPKSSAIHCYSKRGSSWCDIEPEKVEVSEETIECANMLLYHERFTDLIDFDDHLNNIELDWRNIDLVSFSLPLN